MSASVSRRGFFVGAATAASAARVLGANDRLGLGIIGVGGRGSYLMSVANEVGQFEWIAVSDAWDERRQRAMKLTRKTVPSYGDHRRLLEHKEIDGVIVATLDHLHAGCTIDACKAGKDVYVEKPMTSLPMQGHEVVRTVRETNRIVQVGVQQRSMPHFIEAKKRFFDSGLIGRINLVRTIWNANGGYLTPVPPGMEQKPAGLDWDACLGWLPKIPWDPKRYFNRFAYWDFATGGQTGGLFVHLVDVVHWYLGLHQPLAAVAEGGIYRYDDGRDTPDTINFILQYPQKLNVTFEATLTDGSTKEHADIVFLGSGGKLEIFRGHLRFFPSKENAHIGELNEKGSGETGHMANWLECIRTRKQPNADVVEGHYSAMACHIGNMAYQNRARILWQKQWDV